MKNLNCSTIIKWPLLFFMLVVVSKNTSAASGSFKTDSTRIIKLIYDANQLIFDNKDKTFAYLYEAKQLSLKHSSEFIQACVYLTLADVHEVYYEIDSCNDYLAKAIPLFKKLKDNKRLLLAYNISGNNFNHAGNYPGALEHFLIALDLAEKEKDDEMKAAIYNNIGNVYNNQSDQPRALKYYEEAAKSNIKTGNKTWLSANYGNLSKVYEDLNKKEEALRYARMACALDKETGNDYQLANAYSSLGLRFASLHIKDSALYYSKKSLWLYKKQGIEEGIAREQVNWASLISTTNPDSALYYARASLTLGLKIKSLNVQRSAYEMLSFLYSKKGDYKNAYLNYIDYIKIKDSITSEDRIAETASKEASFKYQQKQEADSLKRAQEKFEADVLASQKEERQTYIRYSLLVIILLLAGFGIYVFINFRRKSKLSNDLAFQKDLVEEKNREIIDSINYAQRIQNAILAPEKEIKKYLPDSYLLYKPKDIVAGDFYFFETNETHLFYAAADCTGHGVPGAMVSVVCANALTRCVKEFGLTDPGKILDKTRELVVETFEKSGQEVKDGMDISLISIKVDDLKDLTEKAKELNNPSNDQIFKSLNDQSTINNPPSTVEVSWAGANNPLWYVKDNALKELIPDKQAIGLVENSKPFNTHWLSLSKGDQLFLFTDGFPDQFGGPKGKKFKYSSFREIIEENKTKNMQVQKENLNHDFEKWKGNYEQTDDVCVIGIQL